jgi:hypothetical protein
MREQSSQKRNSDNFINANSPFLSRYDTRHTSFKKNRDFQRSSALQRTSKPIHTQLGIIWMHHRTASTSLNGVNFEDDSIIASHLPDDTTDCEVTDLPVFDPLTGYRAGHVVTDVDDAGKRLHIDGPMMDTLMGLLLSASMDIKWDQYTSTMRYVLNGQYRIRSQRRPNVLGTHNVLSKKTYQYMDSS